MSRPARTAAAEVDARRLRIRASRLVTSLFAGEYRSVFRGRGMEFESVREYQPGDDVRSIDWNVTARAGHPYVRQYIEERELSLLLLLDRSASLTAVSPHGGKRRLAAETAALLAVAASRGNDRVGLIAFSDRIECFLPPAKGPRHVQRLIAELAVPPRAGSGSDLAAALDHLERTRKRGAVVFVISDFQVGDFRHSLAAVAHRHEVVAICLRDVLDTALPEVGLIELVDPESGARCLLDSSSAAVRAAWQRRMQERAAAIRQTLAATGVEALELDGREAPLHALSRFFLARQRRLGR